jgi:hypothetical protein
METGMETRNSKLFLVIAVMLTGTLFMGLVGIGGLVIFRLASSPTEVAMPPEATQPSEVPPTRATFTPSPLPSATPTAAPTPTLVVAQGSAGPAEPDPSNSEGHDSPGLNSPNPEQSEMPQTGLGLMETIGLGLALATLLGGTRVARRLRAGQ